MKNRTLLLFLIVCVMISITNDLAAQSKSNYVRIARLVIDSSRLDDYKKALKEHAETAVKAEPGVIMLYAVYDKEHPANVSVFEIYADQEAYNFHIKQPHFLKYKSTVEDMVKSLQLIDVVPIALESKLRLK